MSYDHEDVELTQEELDSPMGEKPWPLRLAIPAMLKNIGRLYMWGCTVGVTAFIIFKIAYSIVGE